MILLVGRTAAVVGCLGLRRLAGSSGCLEMVTTRRSLSSTVAVGTRTALAATTQSNERQRQRQRQLRRQSKCTVNDTASTKKKAVATKPKMIKKNSKRHEKNESSSNSNSSSSSSSTASNDESGPWYRVFTKGDAEYEQYMATEWATEQRGDRALFELICLEGAQSGLSWLTILRKREAYRCTFFQFDPQRVSQMTPKDVDRVLLTEISNSNSKSHTNTRNVVVRHRGKIEAVIHNAKCLLMMQQQQQQQGDNSNCMALDSFLWSFVNDKPILNHHPVNSRLEDLPSQSPESQAMSKALKKAGWKFVGPTTCYALMQASGMVIDHPMGTPEWQAAKQRLEQRPGGYQPRGG